MDRREKMQKELDAMTAIDEILETLSDDESRRRVLRMLLEQQRSFASRRSAEAEQVPERKRQGGGDG